MRSPRPPLFRFRPVRNPPRKDVGPASFLLLGLVFLATGCGSSPEMQGPTSLTGSWTGHYVRLGSDLVVRLQEVPPDSLTGTIEVVGTQPGTIEILRGHRWGPDSLYFGGIAADSSLAGMFHGARTSDHELTGFCRISTRFLIVGNGGEKLSLTRRP